MTNDFEIYITKGGEMIDEIVSAHYADLYSSKLLTEVMTVNQGVLPRGFYFESGVSIMLPMIKKTTIKESVSLW